MTVLTLRMRMSFMRRKPRMMLFNNSYVLLFSSVTASISGRKTRGVVEMKSGMNPPPK